MKKFLLCFLVCLGSLSAGCHLFIAPGNKVEKGISEYYQSFYSFTTNTVTLEPFVANLEKYTVHFANPTQPSIEGFVEKKGKFATLESKIVTNPSRIAELIKNNPRLDNVHLANLQGYGTTEVIWIDKKKRYAILGGGVANKNFVDRSSAVNKKYFPQDLADRLYRDVQKDTVSFRQGSRFAPRTIYVLGEPNCPACHDLYYALKPFVDNKELSIHWSLVFFIKPSSRGKGAAILMGQVPPNSGYSPTRIGAWNYNEQHFILPETGGIPPAKDVTLKTGRQLNQNELFFLSNGFTFTPVIFFKNKEGTANFTGGTPSNVNAFVNNLFVY